MGYEMYLRDILQSTWIQTHFRRTAKPHTETHNIHVHKQTPCHSNIPITNL